MSGGGKSRLRLDVGLTDYRDHCGTNLSPGVTAGLARQYNSQCIGVGGWVITGDNKATLILYQQIFK